MRRSKFSALHHESRKPVGGGDSRIVHKEAAAFDGVRPELASLDFHVVFEGRVEALGAVAVHRDVYNALNVLKIPVVAVVGNHADVLAVGSGGIFEYYRRIISLSGVVGDCDVLVIDQRTQAADLENALFGK